MQGALAAFGDFHELLYGALPSSQHARELLSELPPGVPSERKLLAVIWTLTRRPAGLLSAYRDYPADGEWFVGDLALAPSLRGRGLGTHVLDEFARWAKARGARVLHLVVQETNPGAVRFWKSRAFREAGQTRQQLGTREHVVIRMRSEL